MYVERAGGALERRADRRLRPGGRFVIDSSSSPHGQGHDITFAQIAAERLHAAPAAIELRFGDSATSPPGVGTFGSRSVAQAGSAVALAAEALVGEARALAAHLLGVAPTRSGLTADGFRRRRAGRSPGPSSPRPPPTRAAARRAGAGPAAGGGSL